MSGTLREATFEDGRAATELLARLGLVMPKGEADIRALWQRLWKTNPAFETSPRPLSLGWVLEDEGRMVGFFGNIPMLYFMGHHAAIAADAALWGVEPTHRQESGRLAQAYFDQSGVDLLFVTTGIKPTGRIFERHGARRLPQPGFGTVWYWIADGPGFVAAALRKRGAGQNLAGLSAKLGGPLLDAGIRIWARRPKAPSLSIDLTTLDRVGPDFDRLWERKLAEGPRFMACRDARSLRWHFATNDTMVLTHTSGGELLGYMALIRADSHTVGLRRYKIADVFIAEDNSDIFDALLGAAFEATIKAGAHVLELIGLPEVFRRRARVAGPFVRAVETWPFYYKPVGLTLSKCLEDPGAWYATPFDGDTTLM